MELEFSAEQDELRDGVRTVLERECPMSLVRAAADDPAAADGLWKQMVDLGWPALTVAEDLGGLGLGPIELAVVVEELGRVVAPGPFVPTVCQFAPTVREVGDRSARARFLSGVADGSVTGALAFAEPAASVDPASVTVEIARDGDGWRVSGTKTPVLGAERADELVVVGREPGTAGDEGVTAVVVPRTAVTPVPVRALDATRDLSTVTFDGVHVDADRCLAAPGPASASGLRRALEEATVALAIEIVGTCQTIFDVTLDYAKQREQFGVPIGSFQAIKHKFADMAIALERARATAYFAALCQAEDDPQRAIATSTAKVAADACQRRLAKEGIQIHGGIGYTWEHDMHRYVRRVKTDAALLGTAAEHRARIADLLGL
jgi:alkylation response protein AidB-like acyl-CoA dehydrogenase